VAEVWFQALVLMTLEKLLSLIPHVLLLFKTLCRDISLTNELIGYLFILYYRRFQASNG